MKRISFNGENFEAEKIIKTDKDITGYIGDNIAFSFKGITNFSLFKLEGGQEFDMAEKDIEAMNYLDFDFRLSKIELGL